MTSEQEYLLPSREVKDDPGSAGLAFRIELLKDVIQDHWQRLGVSAELLSQRQPGGEIHLIGESPAPGGFLLTVPGRILQLNRALFGRQ